MNDPVLTRLKELEERDGILSASAVLADAFDPESPLHSQFEWGDAKAAHIYRISQARQLIRQFHLKVQYKNTTLAVHFFLEDPDKEDTHDEGYVPTAKIATDQDRARRSFQLELKRAIAHVVRVRNLSVYFGMEADCKKVEQALRTMEKLLG